MKKIYWVHESGGGYEQWKATVHTFTASFLEGAKPWVGAVIVLKGLDPIIEEGEKEKRKSLKRKSKNREETGGVRMFQFQKKRSTLSEFHVHVNESWF